MGDGSNHNEQSEHGERISSSDEPDTEPGEPPTTEASQSPSPDSEALKSIDVSVQMESSIHAKTPHTISTPARSLAETARSPTESGPGASGKGHTTLQSMMKPDVPNAGLPHSRRFLTIENDLDQTSAAVRLQEKRLETLRRDVRIALFLAAAGFLVALVALAL